VNIWSAKIMEFVLIEQRQKQLIVIVLGVDLVGIFVKLINVQFIMEDVILMQNVLIIKMEVLIVLVMMDFSEMESIVLVFNFDFDFFFFFFLKKN